MRKYLVLMLLFVVLSVCAYETAGKFGMGVKFWGSPIITFSNVKYGISDIIGIEPSIGYYNLTREYDTNEYSDDIFFISLICNFKPIRANRSNLIIKLGGIYANTSTSYPASPVSPTDNYAILFGIGIEHFINDNFSVNVGALSGYWKSSFEEEEYSMTLKSFGSQLVDFSLVWYLK